MKHLIYLLLMSIFLSCTNSTESETTNDVIENKELTPVQIMEESHQKQAFLSHQNIQFDVVLNFGGNERMNGTMTLATNSSRGLIEMKDGNKIYFIEDKVHYTPGMNEQKVRFDAYTWSYFFLFPYKLSDEGTIWSDMKQVEMNGKYYNHQQLTFASGTGDAPDDWYQVYSDKETNLMEVAAYIVTANKSREKAEEDPHAIAYKNYQKVDGISIAHNWEFFGWTKTEGLTDTLGNATLSNFKFVEDTDSLFVPPTYFSSI